VISLQAQIIEYMREFFFGDRSEGALPPTPDTLPHLLHQNKKDIAKAISALVEGGLVTLVTFHNRLEFTEIGAKTFKSRTGDNDFNRGK